MTRTAKNLRARLAEAEAEMWPTVRDRLLKAIAEDAIARVDELEERIEDMELEAREEYD